MFRYPDKPNGHIARSMLPELRGDWLTTLKMDGWRCLISIDDYVVTYTSRNNKPLPVPSELRAAIEPGLLAHAGSKAVIDAEWLERRPGARDQGMWLFDLLELGSASYYTIGAAQRFERLVDVLGPTGLVVPYTRMDPCAFFDAYAPGGPQHMPEAEGIVLKRADSPYLGNVRKSVDNPAWTRCKWRAGEDGLTAIGGDL